MLFRFYHPNDQSILFLYNDEIPQIIKKREDGHFKTIQFIFDRMNVTEFFFCLIKGKSIAIKSRYEASAVVDGKRMKLTKPYDSKRVVLKILGIDDKDLLIINDKRNNQYIWPLSDEEMMISSKELQQILHPSIKEPVKILMEPYPNISPTPHFENGSLLKKPHPEIHEKVEHEPMDKSIFSIKSVQNHATDSRSSEISFEFSNGGFEEFERETTEKRKCFENKMTAFDQDFKRDKDKSKGEFEDTKKRFAHELIEQEEEYQTSFKDEEDRYSQQQGSFNQIKELLGSKSQNILDISNKMDVDTIIDSVLSRSTKLDASSSKRKDLKNSTNNENDKTN